MSFDYPQSNGYQVGTDFDGSTLQHANFVGGGAIRAFGNELRRLRFFRCGDSVCARCGDGVTTFTIDPHAAAFNRDVPHLYSVEVIVTAPHVGNGRLACKWNPPLPTLPGRWVCDGLDQAHYQGTVTAGDALRFLDHSGNEIDPTFESTPAPGGAIYSPFWPDRAIYDPGVVVTPPNNTAHGLLTGRAYLENPDPVWPIPDAQGSTFGRALWTLEQIPWEISVTLTHHNHEHNAAPEGSIALSVRGYIKSRRTSVPASVVAGPGSSGIRSRGRIVGNRAPGVSPS